MRPAMLENSLIVAAHPDDEMLWFGAIIGQVDDVLLVFEDFWPDPELGPARARALAAFPRSVETLRLPEAASMGCANWKRPAISETGLEFTRTVVKRDAKQTALRALGKSTAPEIGIAGQYAANFESLVNHLRQRLRNDMNVFTHNPWGEYGHEDHVQLFRALDLLRSEIGFTLWMSNYCTERALPLAMRYFQTTPEAPVMLPVDKALCEELAQLYRDSGCWTWSDDWLWFDTEHYMQAPSEQGSGVAQGHLFPLNFFNIDPLAHS